MPDRLTRLVHEMDGAGAPVLVVSPHLDDAVLSCGALLAHLTRRCHVVVATVFTEAAPRPWSVPARRQLRALGMDAESLFEQRRAEDRAVVGELGAAAIHLGLTDALFRRVGGPAARPQSRRRRPTYPTFRFDAARGRIARADAGLSAEVGERIADTIRASGAVLVFAPLGIGRHVDHVITRQAAHGIGTRTVYYSDFPYSEAAAPEPGFVRRAALVPHPWLPLRAENAKRIAGYRSQFAGLFPHGTVPTRPEIYWIPAKDSAIAT